MLITAVEIVYAAAACYLAGFAVSKVAKRVFAYSVHSFSGMLIMGFAVINTYAQIWHFFAPLGMAALLTLTLILILTLLIFGKDHREYLKTCIDGIRHGRWVIIVILFAALSVIAASEPMDWDTYLYHAQAVEWIEKYHIVTGLANLHMRFGYNSALMTMHALLSLAFKGHPTHIVNGLMTFFMLGISVMRILDMLKTGIRRSVLIYLSVIFYTVYSVSSISSLGTDIVPMLIMLYIFAQWTDLWDTGEREIAPYALLALLGVYDITVKLSAAPLALLALYVLIRLIREKKAGDILCCVITSLIFVIPYLLRNIILTGYLIYPMESIDLFNVEWKVPREVSFWDRADIVAYGRELHDNTQASLNTGFFTWFQGWFLKIDMIPRTALLIVGILSVCALIRVLRGKLRGMDLVIFVSGMLCFLYWLFSSPLMRYGMATVFLALSISAGAALADKSEIKVMAGFISVMILLMVPVKLDRDVLTENENLIWASAYYQYECDSVELTAQDGTKHVVYRPKDGDQGGYDLFPEAPYVDPEYVKMRGNDFSDGFVATEPEEGNK